MNIVFIKKYIPQIIIIAIALLATWIYFFPVKFGGKEIVQHDIQEYRGMTEEAMQFRLKNKAEPYWTNSMFSGMPTNMLGLDQSGNKIKPLYGFLNNIFGYHSGFIFFAFLSMFILMKVLKTNNLAATLASTGFAFSSFMFISIMAGHNSKVACIGFMPLVLAGVLMAYRRNILLGSALAGLGVALQMIQNHIQITFYLFIIILAVVISEFYKSFIEKKLVHFFKASIVLMIGAGLGVGTQTGYLYCTQDYTQYTMRAGSELQPLPGEIAKPKDGLDKDYAFQYSNSISEPLTFLAANYFGGASSGALDKNSATATAMKDNGVDAGNIKQFIQNVPLYFGDQPYVAGPIYIGAIICFLFILGLIILDDKIKYAMLAATIFGVLLTYGSNLGWFNYFLFDNLPLFNKFRAVTMAVVIPQLTLCVIAGLALSRAVEIASFQELKKPLIIALSITIGVLLLGILFSSSSSFVNEKDASYQLPEWLLDAIKQDRKSMRTNDSLRSIFLILITAGSIVLTVIKKLKKEIACTIIVIVCLIDLWSVDKRFLNNTHFKKNVHDDYVEKTTADKIILQDKDIHYRVFNLNNPFNDARTSYYHKSIGGYSPAKLGRYQDMIERHISNNNIAVLNMLNAKYAITTDPNNPVQQITGNLGNAWFINTIKNVNGPDAEIGALDSTFNPATMAVVDIEKFKTKNTNYSNIGSTIKLNSYQPNELKYEVDAATDGFVVFSEVYYKGLWSATLDGKPVDHIRVNYILRGMEMPAGKHQLVFKTDYPMHVFTNNISFISSLLLYAFCIFGFGFSAYKEYSKNKLALK